VPEQVFKLKFALSQKLKHKPELCFGAGQTRMKAPWNVVEGVSNLPVLEKTPKIYAARGSSPPTPIGRPASFILLSALQAAVKQRLVGLELALSCMGLAFC